MNKAIGIACVAFVLVISTIVANANTHQRRDTYQLWKGSPQAPLSVVVKGRCLHAEDSAAHLRLVDYTSSRIVYTCSRKGY